MASVGAVTAASIPTAGQNHSSTSSYAQPKDERHQENITHDFGLLAEPSPAITSSCLPVVGKDSRLDDVVSLLGEYMPSDPNSPLANYISGFMSLRLLLLRARSLEEEECVKTILESFSSYAAAGRDRSDIAIMLARDYVFLTQQQQQQQNSFLGLGQSLMPSGATHAQQQQGSGLSLFGLPSISLSLQNSPALTPIPPPGMIETMSIVSN
jgi:hypothetical protein